MLKLTAITYPKNALSVRHDIEMVKSCILYADEIELISPNASLIQIFSSIAELPEIQRLDLIEALLPALSKSHSDRDNIVRLFGVYRDLRQKFSKTRRERDLYESIKNELDTEWKTVRTGLEQEFSNSGMNELMPAIKENIVRLKDVAASILDSDSDAFVRFIVETIEGAVNSGSTHPLFDENIGNLAASMIRENMIQISSVDKQRMNYVAFTTDILDRLPNFASISINELISIRKDLAKYLTRFRAAMVKYSSQISALTFDSDFNKESEKLLTSEILPIITDIDEQVKGTNYLRKLLKTVTTEPMVLAPSSGLGMLVAKLSAFPTFSAMGIGAITGVVAAILKSGIDWKSERASIEKNQLFFYYKAGVKVAP